MGNGLSWKIYGKDITDAAGDIDFAVDVYKRQELRNAEWFESRLRSLFDGDGQLVIDELWNEKQLSQALRRSRYHAVVIAMTGARGLEAAIQAKQLAPETPLVWWSDDKNFALIAYQLRIPAFLSIDCSDQELYEAMEPIRKRRYGNANCAVQL